MTYNKPEISGGPPIANKVPDPIPVNPLFEKNTITNIKKVQGGGYVIDGRSGKDEPRQVIVGGDGKALGHLDSDESKMFRAFRTQQEALFDHFSVTTSSPVAVKGERIGNKFRDPFRISRQGTLAITDVRAVQGGGYIIKGVHGKDTPTVTIDKEGVARGSTGTYLNTDEQKIYNRYIERKDDVISHFNVEERSKVEPKKMKERVPFPVGETGSNNKITDVRRVEGGGLIIEGRNGRDQPCRVIVNMDGQAEGRLEGSEQLMFDAFLDHQRALSRHFQPEIRPPVTVEGEVANKVREPVPVAEDNKITDIRRVKGGGYVIDGQNWKDEHRQVIVDNKGEPRGYNGTTLGVAESKMFDAFKNNKNLVGHFDYETRPEVEIIRGHVEEIRPPIERGPKVEEAQVREISAASEIPIISNVGGPPLAKERSPRQVTGGPPQTLPYREMEGDVIRQPSPRVKSEVTPLPAVEKDTAKQQPSNVTPPVKKEEVRQPPSNVVTPPTEPITRHRTTSHRSNADVDNYINRQFKNLPPKMPSTPQTEKKPMSEEKSQSLLDALIEGLKKFVEAIAKVFNVSFDKKEEKKQEQGKGKGPPGPKP